MTLEQAIAFLAFSVVAAVTPGPSNVMITATGGAVGIVRGLPCLFGVCAGMGVMMFAVAFGLGAVILGEPLVMDVIRVLGAGFLLWLAWRIATADSAGESADGEPVGFIAAALFQWVNPKSWLVCTGAASTFLQGAAGSALAQAMSFGAVFFVASLPCCFVWLAFGAAMQRLLTTERLRRGFNIAMGAVLAASVILFVT